VPYQPIEDYGVIGNLRTAALVGKDGSIDWLCLPRFDSPSVFAALLDDPKGGRFRIAPRCDGIARKQFYWPETNVLVTRFQAEGGVGEVQDFMPIGHHMRGSHQLVRRVKVMRGELPFRVECRPAFDYARASHRTHVDGCGARFEGPGIDLGLAASVPLARDGDAAVADFTLQEDQTAVFALRVEDRGAGDVACPRVGETEELFRHTVHFWRSWLAKCAYTGRWREMVERAALTLKMLTYEPTGAIVAAPTCSLPESIGGARNWDYRYAWIRDAAFTVYGLIRIGFTSEATAFMRWLQARAKESEWGADGPLQIVYGLDGTHDLPEEELSHLEGYRGSRPVRIGNAASKQLQLDIYGELFDAAYLSNKYAEPTSYESWQNLRRTLDWLADNWQRPDEGVWEVRSGRRHFVYSKLMCWVAFDRGLRLADKRSFPAERARWLSARDRLYDEIMEKGWSEDRGAFVQCYGSSTLDASALIMPLVFFLAPSDPRMIRMLDAIRRPPCAGGLTSDGLVYRYDPAQAPDGLAGGEGTFNMCTFWLVEAMTRAGRVNRRLLDEAHLLFERMLGYASHLGLYAEQIGPAGEALGNFPQAFTHLALISAAFNLDRALGEHR
jgi:GH15 family glucan-1,4-alpha-glucosidase